MKNFVVGETLKDSSVPNQQIYLLYSASIVCSNFVVSINLLKSMVVGIGLGRMLGKLSIKISIFYLSESDFNKDL